MKRLISSALVFCLSACFLISSTPETNTKNQVSLLIQSGLAMKAKGEYEDSIRTLSRCLRMLKSAKDRKEFETDILMNLGVLSWNIGQIKESLDFFTTATNLAGAYGQEDKRQYSRSVIQLTTLYFQGKNLRDGLKYKESIQAFEQAIEIARKIQSGEHEAKCLRQLSIVYDETSRSQEFIKLTLEARDIAKRLNIKRELGYALFNIGRYYFKANIYSLALENFENSHKIAEQIGSPADIADCLMAIGNTYCEIGQYSKALDYLNSALEIHKKQGNETQKVTDLLNLGVTYRRRGFLLSSQEDLISALSYYREALTLSRTLKNNPYEMMILNNIGSVYSDLDNNSEALKYFQEGLAEAQKTNAVETTSMILNNIGIIQAKLGNYELSTRYYQQAIDLALEIHGGQILWEAYLEMANSYKNEGKFYLAIDNYKNSISIIEDIRSNIRMEDLKASFLGTDKRIEPYQQLIDVFIKMGLDSPGKGFDQQAFNYMEKAKARAFLDSLEVAGIDVSQRIDFKLLNQEKEIEGRLSKLYARLALPELPESRKKEILDAIRIQESDYESLKREIRLKSPAYANLRFPQIITLEETQQRLLDSKTAIWAYSIGKESSYVFVITHKNIRISALPPRQELQAKVAEYMKVITDKESRDFDSGLKFGRTLMPLAMDPGVSQIIIVPDDWLNFLPFEALPISENPRQWLIQKYQISYVPSISSYQELLRRGKGRSKRPGLDLLAVGNPLLGPQDSSRLALEASPSSQALPFGRTTGLPGLKFSGLEIKTIASLFNQDKVRLATGEKATKKEFMSLPLDDFKILHFATHAYVDDKNPGRSYLLLSSAKDPESGGFLPTREIYNLKINADLVTLSACQTGLGELIRGEGIEGFSRAFYYAGASAVLMSLWSIDDQASAQLMERFYIHLRASSSLTEALHKTKVEMIQSGTLSHPYYWAGFVLSGKSDTVVFSQKRKTALAVLVALLVVTAAGVLVRKRFRKKSASLR